MSLIEHAAQETQKQDDANREHSDQPTEVSSAQVAHMTSTDQTTIDHSQSNDTAEPWYYDDNQPGKDARPEWLQTKYKSVAEQAKAYVEAQKRFGAFKGAPEAYDIKLEGSDVQFQEADPVIKEFLEQAKENNVSQEYVNKLLSTYAKAIKMSKPDPKREMEALGPNGKEDLLSLGKWADNNLSKDESSAFRNMITTADSVRVLQKLRGQMTKANTQPSQTFAPKASKEDVLKKIHDPRYATDAKYRSQVRDELSQFG
jgi:hypothetical protein